MQTIFYDIGENGYVISTGYKVAGPDNICVLNRRIYSVSLRGQWKQRCDFFLPDVPRPPEFSLWMPQGTRLQVKNPRFGGKLSQTVCGALGRLPRNLFCSGGKEYADHFQAWTSVTPQPSSELVCPHDPPGV